MTQSRLLLVRLRPNIERLTQWAIEKNYLPNRHSTDLGYALHAALKASLGDTAPKPFVLRNETRNGHSSHELLGYVHANPEMDMARPSSPITPETEMLGVSSMEIREMPNTWPLGTRLAFEVRIRPVVRARRSRALRCHSRSRCGSMGHRAGCPAGPDTTRKGRRIRHVAENPHREPRGRPPRLRDHRHTPNKSPAPSDDRHRTPSTRQ